MINEKGIPDIYVDDDTARRLITRILELGGDPSIDPDGRLRVKWPNDVVPTEIAELKSLADLK